MDYEIISAGTVEHLVEKVKVSIQEGWVPLGGITCCSSSKYHQSMVKIERKVAPEGV